MINIIGGVKSLFSKLTHVLNLVSWTVLGTVVKLILSFFSGKLIAIYFGPNGLLYTGQFNNLISVGSNLTSLGGRFAFVKIAAVNAKNDRLNGFYTAAVWLTFLIGYFVAIPIIFFSKDIANNYLFSEDYQYLIVVGVLVLQISNLFKVLNSFTNGLYLIKTQVIQNIITGFIQFLPIGLVILFGYSITGLLGAILVGYFAIGIFALVKVYKIVKQNWKLEMQNIKIVFLYIIKIGLPGLLIALVLPVLGMKIRSSALEWSGLEEAGNWEVVYRTSNLYMLFFLGLINTLLLPKFASKVFSRFKILKISILCLGGSMLVFTLTYPLLPFFIQIAFTNEFLGAVTYFKYQFFIDSLKIGIYIYTMNFLGQGIIWKYMLFDISIPILLYITISFELVSGITSMLQLYCLLYGLLYTLIIVSWWFTKDSNI